MVPPDVISALILDWFLASAESAPRYLDMAGAYIYNHGLRMAGSSELLDEWQENVFSQSYFLALLSQGHVKETTQIHM